jgi:hypothetical protein
MQGFLNLALLTSAQYDDVRPSVASRPIYVSDTEGEKIVQTINRFNLEQPEEIFSGRENFRF